MKLAYVNGAPILGPEDPGERAHLPHRDGDGGGLHVRGDLEDPHGVGQRVGPAGDLDDVGVEFLGLLGDLQEVGRRLLEVVIRDDPPGLAEAADVAGDVHLDVDEVDSRHDRLAHQPLPLLLRAPEQAAVGTSPRREDERRGGGWRGSA